MRAVDEKQEFVLVNGTPLGIAPPDLPGVVFMKHDGITGSTVVFEIGQAVSVIVCDPKLLSDNAERQVRPVLLYPLNQPFGSLVAKRLVEPTKPDEVFANCRLFSQ